MNPDRQSWTAEARHWSKVAAGAIRALEEQIDEARHWSNVADGAIRALEKLPDDPDCKPNLAASARSLASDLRGRG